MRHIFLLTLSVLFASQAIGSDSNKYEFCEIYGIAGGASDTFTQTLAARILEKQGLLYDNICSSVSQDAYKFGQRYSSGTDITAANSLRWQKYQDFRDRIADKILEMAGY